MSLKVTVQLSSGFRRHRGGESQTTNTTSYWLNSFKETGGCFEINVVRTTAPDLVTIGYWERGFLN